MARAALLELQMGHLPEAQAAAELAVRRDRKEPEARYVLARAHIADALRLAAGGTGAGVREALQAGAAELREVLKLNPADEEAGQVSAVVETLLSSHKDSAQLASLLA
jgi:hypothetical protein